MPTRAKNRPTTEDTRADAQAQTEELKAKAEEPKALLDQAVLHELNVVLREQREDVMNLVREDAQQQERVVQLTSSLKLLQERFDVEVARLSEMNVTMHVSSVASAGEARWT